jgi:hypothetical protein
MRASQDRTVGVELWDVEWAARFETDYGLRWGGHKHQVWTTQDGFAYDGKKTDDAA